MRRSTSLIVTTLGLALAIAYTAGCATTTTPIRVTTSDSTRTLLLGSWTFASGCGGLAYQCRTADALGEPTRYVFRSDDSVEAYHGADRLFVTDFTVRPGAVKGSGGDDRPTLLIGTGPTTEPRPLLVQFQGNGTVLLDEGCCDRFTLEYARGP